MLFYVNSLVEYAVTVDDSQEGLEVTNVTSTFPQQLHVALA